MSSDESQQGQDKKKKWIIGGIFACAGCLAMLAATLTILGVVATNFMPQMLDASRSSMNTAIFKETAAIISGSFRAYQQASEITAKTSARDFQNYWNYVKEESVLNLDNGISCAAAATRCLRLHNGGVLAFNPDQAFDAVDTTRYLVFDLDPDGEEDALPVSILLFDTGRIATGEDAASGIPGIGSIKIITTNPDYVKAAYEKR